MTYPMPFGVGNASQTILDTVGQVMEVNVQNVSAVNVFVSSKQSVLDGSVDNVGQPHQGFVLPPAPSNIVLHWNKFKGQLYARAGAGGGAVECDSVVVCP
jgi:hypothetical protein